MLEIKKKLSISNQENIHVMIYHRQRTIFTDSRYCTRPIVINSLTGLVNTLITIYTGGSWSVTARAAVIVMSSLILVCGSAVLFFEWQFSLVKRMWDEEKEIRAKEKENQIISRANEHMRRCQ